MSNARDPKYGKVNAVSSDPKRVRIPLAEQAAEAQREIAFRHRVYPGSVRNGKLTQAAADQQIAVMRAIRDTLQLFARYEDDVRATLERCLARDRDRAELAEMQRHPLVQTLCNEFDGEVRPPDPAREPDSDFDAARDQELFPSNPDQEQAA